MLHFAPFPCSVGLHLLLKLSVYMAELSDYEYKRMVADEQVRYAPNHSPSHPSQSHTERRTSPCPAYNAGGVFIADVTHSLGTSACTSNVCVYVCLCVSVCVCVCVCVQGTLPPDPPKLMSVEDAAQVGVYYSLRELATSFVKTAYEHLFYWKLGPERSQPFLRNGPVWVVQVLRPKHADSPVSKKVGPHAVLDIYAASAHTRMACSTM